MQKRSPLAAVMVALVVLHAPIGASTSCAADAPSVPPAPAPSLVVTDKAPLGCCCISTNEPGTKAGCNYGLSEAVCAKAGKAVATWTATWTAGKCPTP